MGRGWTSRRRQARPLRSGAEPTAPACCGRRGCTAMVISPADYASKLAVIHAAARDAGRDPESITPALHRFAVIGPTEHETQAMLDTKVIRAFGLSAPAELWHRLGREHPFGERFRGYVDIVPERYDR